MKFLLLAIVLIAPPGASIAQVGGKNAADAALNANYRAAMNRKVSAAALEKLRISQRAWIAYRDASVAAATTAVPGDPQVAAGHLSWETMGRSGLLKRYYVDHEEMRADPDNTGLAKADGKLNADYRATLATFPPNAAGALRQAQQLWVANRDADLAALEANGVISSWNAAWFFLRTETQKRTLFLATLASKAKAETPQAPVEVGLRLKWEPVAVPESAGPQVSEEPGKFVPRIDGGRQGASQLMLDMDDQLLACMGESGIDFWDVQTGGLIRSIPLVQPAEDEADATTVQAVGIGNGQIAVMASFDRERQRLVQFYSRETDSKQLRIGGYGADVDLPFYRTRDMVMASASGHCAILCDPPSGNDQPAGQDLFVRMREGEIQKLTIPAESEWKKRWQFLAISRDARFVNVASDSRVLTLALADGSVVGDVRVSAKVSLIGMIACPNSDGVVVCSDSGDLFRVGQGATSFESVGRLALPPGKKHNFKFAGIGAGWYAAKFWQNGTKIVAAGSAPAPVRDLLSSLGDKAFAFDKAGEFAAVQNGSGTVTLYHLPSGLEVRTFGTPVPDDRLVEISADGGTLVSCRRAPDGTMAVNVFSPSQMGNQTLAVKPFDQLLGMNRSVTRLVVHQKTGQRFKSRLESSSYLTSLEPGSTSVSIGIVDLRSGETVERLVENPRGGWQFDAGSDMLFGLTGQSELLLLNPFDPGAGRAHRIPIGKVLPSRFEIGTGSISISPDLQTLAIVTLDQLVLVDISNPAKIERIGLCNLGEFELGRFASARFSHSGKQVAIVRYQKITAEVAVVETRQPTKVLWSSDLGFGNSIAFTLDDQCLCLDDVGRNEGGMRLVMLEASTGRSVASMEVEGRACKLAHDGTRSLVQSEEGGWHMIGVGSGVFSRLARFVPGPDGSHAFMLPDGHYLATGEARRLISFSSGARSQPAEALDIRFNRPDLVVAALGAKPEWVKALHRAYLKRLERLGISEGEAAAGFLPPEVRIGYDHVPPTTEELTLRLPVTVQAHGAPLAALEVTVNDVPVLARNNRALNVARAQAFSEELDIELASGSNKITVRARDVKGLTSSRVSVSVTLAEATPKPRTLHVLAVGVDDYPGTKNDLALCGKDASDIAAAFQKQSGFGEVRLKVLKDGEATRSGILNARTFLEEASVNDQVIVFFAGHGALDEDYEYRFLCADLDVERIPDTTLSYPEIESLFANCRARKRVMLLDTCHAGEADRDDARLAKVEVVRSKNLRSIPFQGITLKNSPPADSNVIELLNQHFVDLRIGTGAAVLSSSDAHQEALEIESIRNGIFTAAVLQGLRDLRADGNKDKVVRISELLDYCKTEVRRLSGGQQEPVARHVNLAEDFVVAGFR
jgi:uncharacterized protein YecT (DUF1311 family)